MRHIAVAVSIAIPMAALVAASDKYPGVNPAGGDIEITPIIHSSVQIEYGGKVIQVDPWSVGDFAKIKPADLILVTDDPVHHLDVKAIQLFRKPGAPVVIPSIGRAQLPDGVVLSNGETTTIAGMRLEAIPAYDIKPGPPEHPKGKSNGYVIPSNNDIEYAAGWSV